MNTYNPLVSIITPTYNQAEYLEQAIESVLNQDYPNIEYLVINDGSTDNTESVLRKYDGRIKWITQPNSRENPTINRALKMVKGEIIGKLSSDDFFYPSLVTEVVEAFRTHQEIIVAYPDYDVIDENNKNIFTYSMEYDFLDSLQNHKCIAGVGAFYHRRLLDTLPGLDTSFIRVADVLFWWNAGLLGPFHHIPKTLGAFRVHSGSQTYQGGLISARETTKVVKRFFQNVNLPLEVQKVKREALSSAYFVASIYASKEKTAVANTIGYFIKMIFTNPSKFFSSEGIDRRNYVAAYLLKFKVFIYLQIFIRFLKPKTKSK